MKTSSEDSPASKPSSTTDADPGEAPIAIESPNAVLSKQDLSGSHGSGAVIQVGANGWLIALASVSLTALILILAFAPSYIDNKVQAGIAEGTSRLQADVADANATAKLARAEASAARDKVEDLRVELERTGIKVGPLDGH